MKLRHWVDVGEITASIAVVVTLLLLIFQMRESDEIERVQNSVRLAQWDAQMFLLSDRLPEIAAKIEAVSNENFMAKFRQRYDLSIEEAGIWNRWLFLIWKGLEADYLLTGPNDQLEKTIRQNATYEDQQLTILSTMNPGNTSYDAEFIKYVNSLLEERNWEAD